MFTPTTTPTPATARTGNPVHRVAFLAWQNAAPTDGAGNLTPDLNRSYSSPRMETHAITLEQIDRAHRQNRAEEARRIAARLATAEKIQEENSMVPWTLPVRVFDLAGYARQQYAR